MQEKGPFRRNDLTQALRQRAGVAVLTGALAWGCGLLGPNDGFDVDASFTGTHDAGVCTFVFRAKATQPEETVFFSYKFNSQTPISPTTWGNQVLLEDSVGSFRDSIRLTWDAPLGTRPAIGRFLRFSLSAGFFLLEDGISVICGS